jgi:hypothetical protein
MGKIDVIFSSKNGKYTIDIAQPMIIETILSIFLNGIITDNNDSHIYLCPLYTRSMGMEAYILIITV